jgi:hypothetical protein
MGEAEMQLKKLHIAAQLLVNHVFECSGVLQPAGAAAVRHICHN